MLKDPSLETPRPTRLRAVVPEDYDFLLGVYASTRAEEMKLVLWDEAQRNAFLKMQADAQQQHYRSTFPTATQTVIELEEQPIGRLYVLRTDDFIRILDLTLLPEFRNLGLGTPIIEDLINEAAATRKPLRIFVESFNPSLRLFERLGFQKADEQGMHFLMELDNTRHRSNDE